MAKHRARDHTEATELEHLPNVGRAVAGDLRQLGIGAPSELRGRDPYALYDDLCRLSGQRVDPCMLDTFIAIVRFMDGGPARPWWAFTAERKATLARRSHLTDAESAPAAP